MNKTQKDPGQVSPIKSRHVQAREHQILFPRTIDSDAKLIAAIEIELLEGLEARHQQKLHEVIEHLKKLADGTPSAKVAPEAVDLIVDKT